MTRCLTLPLLALSLLSVLPGCDMLTVEEAPQATEEAPQIPEEPPPTTEEAPVLCDGVKPGSYINRPPIAVEGLQQLVHKPLLVLYENENVHIGRWQDLTAQRQLDFPSFVLYEDGLVTVNKWPGEEKQEFDKPVESYQLRLSPTETSDLFNEIVTAELEASPDHTDISTQDDQDRSVKIQWRHKQRWYLKEVKAINRQGRPTDYRMGGYTRGAPPCGFLKSYLDLLAFDGKSGRNWKKPDSVAVWLHPAKSKEPGLPWPTGLPLLPANGVPLVGSQKLAVDSDHEDNIRSFMAHQHRLESSRSEPVPLLYNGQKWTISVRPLVPERDYLNKVNGSSKREYSNRVDEAVSRGFGVENIRSGISGEDTNGIVSDEPIILGALHRSLIDEVVNRHLKDIRYCYQRDLMKTPTLKGEIVTKLIIDREGSVPKASMKTSTMKSASVESCVVSRFEEMQFPKPKGGGIAIVSYPFTFWSGGNEN
jgi:hypothetical protein